MLVTNTDSRQYRGMSLKGNSSIFFENGNRKKKGKKIVIYLESINKKNINKKSSISFIKVGKVASVSAGSSLN